MFGDLIRGEADLLPCSLYLTPTRVVSADFLIPLGYDSMTLFVWTGGAGDGEAGRIDVGTFAMPFTPQLWAALALIALAITASAVLQRIYQVDKKNDHGVAVCSFPPGSRCGCCCCCCYLCLNCICCCFVTFISFAVLLLSLLFLLLLLLPRPPPPLSMNMTMIYPI